MSDQLVDHRHPVEGRMTLMRSGNVIELKLRWPLDREEDEWIALIETYDIMTYIREIARLRSSGKARLSSHSSKVTFSLGRCDKEVNVDFQLISRTPLNSFSMYLPISVDQLILGE